jgi:DNA repair photolyase
MDHPPEHSMRGRGSGANPANRFEALSYTPDWEDLEETPDRPRTVYYRDSSKTILTPNDSPDIRYDFGINPYRGCEHGCSYCYARPYHEYLGLSAGLDFETKILVKEDAPQLLRKELSSPKWKPQAVGMSGVTDCYQPVEKDLRLTRACLEVLAEFRNPVWVVTKNHLVARDVDLLQELARHRAAAVYLSLNSLKEEIRRPMEPRTSSARQRLEAISQLSEAGVPTGILIAPVVPGLTDTEIPALVQAASAAGASFATYITLRLPMGVGPLFDRWLQEYFPTKRDKVMAKIRDLHGGHLNDTESRVRMTGKGHQAEQLAQVFRLALKKTGIARNAPDLSAAAFRPPHPIQQTLF